MRGEKGRTPLLAPACDPGSRSPLTGLGGSALGGHFVCFYFFCRLPKVPVPKSTLSHPKSTLRFTLRFVLPLSWVGYPRRRPKGCGMQSPLGPKVYPKSPSTQSLIRLGQRHVIGSNF